MDSNVELKKKIHSILDDNNGVLRLRPTWVARKGIKSGKQLNLDEKAYDLGERGEITERWIASLTRAEKNDIGPPDEGLSYIFHEKDPYQKVTLKEAFLVSKDLIMGKNYSNIYDDSGILSKILSNKNRLLFHYHQRMQDTKLINRKSKEEAYYFPEDSEFGGQSETFFGFHPYITEQKRYDLILNELVNWESDKILSYSRAYKQNKNDGFHLPAGIPHAPGSALTIEMQVASDVSSNLQALYNGRIMPKKSLFRYIREIDIKKYGEKVIIDQLDWERSGDLYFYENRHTPPILIDKNKQTSGKEYWVFYNSSKFSGKLLTIEPNKEYSSIDNGFYTALIWQGKGLFDGHLIEAKNFNYDEIVVTHDKAVNPITIKNTSNVDLKIFKFFGPNINPDTPMLKQYVTSR